MNPAVLVGRRPDDGWRDRVWGFCARVWQEWLDDAPICEGYHLGSEPFSLAAASNAAYRVACSEFPDWDVALYVGADWLTGGSYQPVAALASALATNRLVFAHDRTAVLDETLTRSLVGGAVSVERAIERHDDTWHANTFSGVLAVPRRLWQAVGGFDERFATWGFEDLAFFAACSTMAGTDRIPGPLLHLWHERNRAEREDNPGHGKNQVLWESYKEARGNKPRMHALLREPGGPLHQ